jgi:putative redox protein
MDATVSWKQRMSFDGKTDSGFTVQLGTSPEVGGDDDGPRPMELFLVGLGGCTGMDVISILSKKKQEVSSFDIKVHAEKAEQHPKVFTSIEIEYVVGGKDIDRAAVERAVQLSSEKYCPAQAMLSQIVPLTTRITILDK